MRILAWPASSQSSGNAYNSLLTQAVEEGGSAAVEEFSLGRALLRRWDVWHLHWPQHVFYTRSRLKVLAKLAVLVVLVHWRRARGTKLVWTVHNLRSHDGLHPELESRFMTWLVGRLDGAIVLSERGAHRVAARFPRLSGDRVAVIEHGHYLDAYPSTLQREEARAALGLRDDEVCVAFVGRIAPYKGVPDLVRQFRSLAGEQLRLVVAGQPSSAAERSRVEEAASGDPRIGLYLHPVGDCDLQRFLRAADLVALPYRDVFNSGSALLALSFLRPVLVPNAGALAELQERFGAGWVRIYHGELTAAALRHALSVPRPDEAALRQRLQQELDWRGIGTRTRSFFEELVAA